MFFFIAIYNKINSSINFIIVYIGFCFKCFKYIESDLDLKMKQIQPRSVSLISFIWPTFLIKGFEPIWEFRYNYVKIT